MSYSTKIGKQEQDQRTYENNAEARRVMTVDSSGNYVAGGGSGGVQYTEGDTDSTITGTASLWEDTSDTLRVPSATYPLPVNIISGAGSGGTAIQDDATFTPGTTSLTPVGGIVTSDLVDSGDSGAFLMDEERHQQIDIQDISKGTQTNDIKVTLDGETVPVTQSGTWNLTNISGTISLPTGASTEATLSTVASDTTSIDSKTPSLGQSNKLGSVPVTLASDEDNINVDVISGVQTDALTDTQLRASPVPVSGSITIQEPLSIDDNGGSITVDGTITANAGTNLNTSLLALDSTLTDKSQFVKLTDGTDDATIRDVTGAKALDVAIVDGSGSQITSFGGGTQYTEDDAGTANPVGTAQALIRQDTPASLVSADGDVVARRGTNYGAAFSQIVDSSGNFVDTFGGGTQYSVDDALGATPTGTLNLAIRDDTLSTLTPVEGDAVGLRVDSNGALWSTINGTVTVDGSGVTQPISAVSLPLPSGASTLSEQQTQTTHLATIAGDTTSLDSKDFATETTLSSLNSKDLMLGTDFSNVMGTSSLILGTQADDIVNTSDGLQVSNFNYVFDGTAWDRLRGDSTNGMLVNLGSNNDVTITSGNVTVDNAGTFAVQSTLQTGSNTIGKVHLTDGTDDATIRDVTGAKALDVAIVDGSGNQITSFGGGTEYTEGDTDVSITGKAILWEDSADTLRTVSASKPLPVDIISSIPAGTNNIGDVDVLTLPDVTQTTHDNLNANANIQIGDVDVSTTNAVPIKNDSTGTLTIDGTVSATQSGTWNIGTITSITNDVSIDDGGNSITVDGSVDVQGNVAHNAVDSGDPVKIGGKARTSNPTAVANGDRVDATFDDVGRQVVTIGQPRDLTTHSHTNISTTSETTILSAGGAGVYHDITQLILSNNSNTKVKVTIKDSTGGTTRTVLTLAAGGGGAVIPFMRPLTQSTANNNWTATLDSAVSVDITVQAEVNV